MTSLTPREIVSELDRFIIGQRDAKRAVAVALRNRWRRQRLPAELREQFIAVLGHDLRNPLFAITAGAELLTQRLQDDQQRGPVRVIECVLVFEQAPAAAVRVGQNVRVQFHE